MLRVLTPYITCACPVFSLGLAESEGAPTKKLKASMFTSTALAFQYPTA